MMTRKEFRRFLRHLMQVLRQNHAHRELRHSLKQTIEEFYYK